VHVAGVAAPVSCVNTDSVKVNTLNIVNTVNTADSGRSSIRFSCVNVRGLMGKIHDFAARLASPTAGDLIGVCETWLRDGEPVPAIDCFQWEQTAPISAPDEGIRGAGGVGVWTNSSLAGVVCVEKSERVMWYRVTGAHARATHVAFCYAPVEGKTDEAKVFWDLLDDNTAKFSAKGDIVILGDLNGRVGECTGDTVLNSNGKRILSFCDTHRLAILNEAHAKGKQTFFGHDDANSIIDYVLVSRAARDRVVVMGVCDDTIDSDHREVFLEWRTDTQRVKKQRPKNRRRWKMPRSEEEWLQYRGISAHNLTLWAGAMAHTIAKGDAHAQVEFVWRTFKRAVIDSADASLKRYTSYGRGSLSAFRADPEVVSLLAERTVAHQRYRAAAGDDRVPAAKVLQNTRKRVSKLVRKKARAATRAGVDRLLELDNEGTSSQFWKQVRRVDSKHKTTALPAAVQRPDGSLATTKEEMIECWAEHYRRQGELKENTLFDSARFVSVSERVRLAAATGEPAVRNSVDLGHAITLAEVQAALKRCASGKSSDPNMLVNELFTKSSPMMERALLHVFSTAWSAGYVPRDWLRAHVVPIYKNTGTKTDPASYRPIALMSVVAKMYETIINQRVTKFLEENKKIGPEQAGFRKGMGCIDHIFALHETLAERREQGKPTYLCFLDLSKAYDLTWRDGVFDHLLSLGIHGKIWNVMRDLYRAVETSVIVNGIGSKYFKTMLGVRQGSVLSPVLFSVFISAVINEWRAKGIGVKVAGKQVGGLLFADDIVLMADSEIELRKALQVMEQYARDWRLIFNAKKCAVVYVGRSMPPHAPWLLQGEVIGDAPSYNYLGVATEGSLSWQEWNVKRTNKGKRCLSMLWWAGARRGALPVAIADRLLEVMLFPSMSYGGEVALPTETQKKASEVALNSAGRQVLGLPRFVPTVLVRGELGWLSLEERREARMLRYWHRLQRMPDGVLARDVFVHRMNAAAVPAALERVDHDDSAAEPRGWVAAMRDVMTKYGLQEFYSIATRLTKLNWKLRVDAAVRERSERDWRTQLVEIAATTSAVAKPSPHAQYASDAVRNYLRLLPTFCRANYLAVGNEASVHRRGRQLHAQLRVSSSPLAAHEAARAVKDNPLPTCAQCDLNVAESTVHALLVCPAHAELRAPFLLQVSKRWAELRALGGRVWRLMAARIGSEWEALAVDQRVDFLLSYDDATLIIMLHHYLVQVFAQRRQPAEPAHPVDDVAPSDPLAC